MYDERGERIRRAQSAVEKLTAAYEAVSSANTLGEYDDLVDHLARKLRIARETLRFSASASRR